MDGTGLGSGPCPWTDAPLAHSTVWTVGPDSSLATVASVLPT